MRTIVSAVAASLVLLAVNATSSRVSAAESYDQLNAQKTPPKQASGRSQQLAVQAIEHHDHEQAGGHPGSAVTGDRTVHVIARDFSFTPDRLTVSPSETIRFVVTNKAQRVHEFVIATVAEHHEHERLMRKMDDPEMMEHEPNGISLKPGQTKTLVWTFERAKNLQFACDIPDHYEAGMHGVIRFSP